MGRFDRLAEDVLDQMQGRIRAATRASEAAAVDLSQLPPPTAGSTIVVYADGTAQSGSLAGTANEVSVTQAGTTLTVALDAGNFLKGYNDAAAIRGRIACGGIAAASADAAAAVGAAYVQAEVQAILNELRDLKAKMRTAGSLAT